MSPRAGSTDAGRINSAEYGTATVDFGELKVELLGLQASWVGVWRLCTSPAKSRPAVSIGEGRRYVA
jgi:hypothetical protein